MKVLVLLELGADVRVAPERDPRSGRVRTDWLVREVDPASSRALDLALRLKDGRPDVHVTLMHLGSPEAAPWLRRALARGADRVVRVWDDEAAGVHAAGKAVVLAAAAQAAGFDLVLAGAAGVLDAGSQLGVLLAAHLGVPSVTQVVDLAIKAPAANGGTMELIRGLDRGFRQWVTAPLPLVATVSAAEASGESAAPPGITASALLAAEEVDITVWDLADLGVPPERVQRAERALHHSRPQERRPRLLPLAAPDPALPAFDRILQLLEGSVRRREGHIVRASPEEIVERLFRALRDEGWLDSGAVGPGAGDRP